jgi:hypothetical protein
VANITELAEDATFYIEENQIQMQNTVSSREEEEEENNTNSTELDFIDRLGRPSQNIPSSRLLFTLQKQLNDLLLDIYDSFTLSNGTLLPLNPKADGASELAKLANDMVSLYFTAKLATLKCASKPVEDIVNSFCILLRLFEDLLKTYSKRGSEALRQEDLNILFAFGFLLSSLSHFVDEEIKTQSEPILVLLISLTSLQRLVDSFKMIFPPAHQSRLFVLTLYSDLERIQATLQGEDADQIAKLKALIELAFIRYGDYFMSSYTEELLFTFNCPHLLECPAAIWNKATQGKSTIQTDLGPSFLVSMLKYQWGLIKDFNGVAADPTNNIILFHTDLENLFEFLNDQAQQLFLLASALNTVLNEDARFRATFNTDAETLFKIYTELMDYLVRIVSGLMDGYSVHSQNEGTNLTTEEQMDILQCAKFHIVLMTFSLCSVQLSLTGPLHISTAPSISPVLEFYLSKSDFTASSQTCELSHEFTKTFASQSASFYSNYSMLKGLSKIVQAKLEGTFIDKGVFNTHLSLNMLSFTVLVIFMFFIQLIWFIQALLAFIEDYFLY